MAVPTGLEPAIPRVTGECDNHYTTEPFGCGSWIWTNDLWVMSPTSYRTALSRDLKIKWRRKRDSNPCADFSTSRFSRPVPSTRLGYSSTLYWCLRSDLNRYELLHSQDFKSCASTYSATEAQNLVSRWRFELQTPWLKVKCSTGWASETDYIIFLVASAGFEPAECKSQSLVPYHLATRQNYKWWREVDSNHRTRRNRFTVCRV